MVVMKELWSSTFSHTKEFWQMIKMHCPAFGMATFLKDNMEVFLTAIGRYKVEMLNDYNPVYDEDLQFCESILFILEYR